jgi:hypothetical protein
MSRDGSKYHHWHDDGRPFEGDSIFWCKVAICEEVLVWRKGGKGGLDVIKGVDDGLKAEHDRLGRGVGVIDQVGKLSAGKYPESDSCITSSRRRWRLRRS